MAQEKPTSITRVIAASSVGTLIEWYDFYIFGSLAVVIGQKLFPPDLGAAALINTLAIFAAGFIVRPFGALFFGRLGDLVGRKYTFMLTLILMGVSTFLIGLIPGYEQWGYGAPVCVLILRLLQGLALGGEYGGAATYVSEHAPPHKRGLYTSWIQTTATLGLFLSLGVIILSRKAIGIENFNEWGWRIPFLASIFLVIISIYIRLKMNESPAFTRIHNEGRKSLNPLKESFRKKGNFKMVLLALFGAVMGQGVVWYTGQFYAQSFIENTCKIDFNTSRYVILWAIVFATPFFIFFGSLSDRIGRKWIIMTGMVLALVTYRPIYKYLYEITTLPEDEVVHIDRMSSEKRSLTSTGDSVITYTSLISISSGWLATAVHHDTVFTNSDKEPHKSKTIYSNKKPPSSVFNILVLLVFIQIFYVTMVYGPIAAFLVELFPTRIRYTSMSLPYHIGNGVFGGLVPFLATLIASFPGSDYRSGLWYPIIVATVCAVIGILYLKNKIDRHIDD